MQSKEKPPRHPPSRSGLKSAQESSTVVWGQEVEKDDFLKVPRALLYLGRYDDTVGKQIHARHLQLLLVLAGRKYQEKAIRVYWEELSKDLGVKPDTVRKWAYQARDLGLLRIRQHRGPVHVDKPGIRNERNSFDLSPFVSLVRKAHTQRMRERQSRRNGGASE